MDAEPERPSDTPRESAHLPSRPGIPRPSFIGFSSTHRPLVWLTLGSTGMLAVCLLLGQLDDRLVGQIPVWVKPTKFAAAIATTAPVLSWILGQMRGGSNARRLHRAGTTIAVLAALELVVIATQAARGVPSHFNNATHSDAALFAVMGIAIAALWLGELYIAVAAFRQGFSTSARAWGIRLGLAAALLGGAIGFLMPHPTPSQLVSLRAGRATPLVGSHSIGAEDPGQGMPVTRWNRTGGDLRVPHFLGLHGLQALPFAAWISERRRRKKRVLAPNSSTAAVAGIGALWLGLTAVTLAQALRGQSLTAPDTVTRGLLGAAVLLALAVATLVIIMRRRPSVTSVNRGLNLPRGRAMNADDTSVAPNPETKPPHENNLVNLTSPASLARNPAARTPGAGAAARLRSQVS